MNEWIKCSDRLPEHNQRVLCFSTYMDVKVFNFGTKSDIFYDGDSHCYCPVGEMTNVKYWMHLPKPPEE